MSLFRFTDPIMDVKRAIRNTGGYFSFGRDWLSYKRLGGTAKLKDLYPVLGEKTATTAVDPHYFYQDLWAFKKIVANESTIHIDVGSNTKFVGFLTTFKEVEFVDIRPLIIDIAHFVSKAGSLIRMPYRDRTVSSLSCLHVVEHVGLGRYGDALDPLGTQKACGELTRILANGGNLYLGIPLGSPRTCFNAHRIHTADQIIAFCSPLSLVDFAGIDDDGKFHPVAELRDFDDSQYACGLFHFRREE